VGVRLVQGRGYLSTVGGVTVTMRSLLVIVSPVNYTLVTNTDNADNHHFASLHVYVFVCLLNGPKNTKHKKTVYY